MEVAKKIIHLFLHHPMPEKTRAAFRCWCLEKRETELKTQLLEEEWLQLDPALVLDIDHQSYDLKLRKLHVAMGLQTRRNTLRTALLRLRPIAAAVALLGFTLTNILIVKHQSAHRSTTTFITADNSKGRFTLPDSTVVWLNSGSRLSFSEDFTRTNHRYVQLKGEAFFDVRKDSLRPFVVEMGQLQVKVLGTRFNACNIDAFGNNEVTLLCGRVEIHSNRLKKPILLLPDEQCIYDTNSRQFSVNHVSANNYCNWTNDMIVFENAPLSSILTSLEHHYNVRFQIAPDIDSSIGLSFTLQPEKLENTLELISTLANLHYLRLDEHFIRIY